MQKFNSNRIYWAWAGLVLVYLVLRAFLLPIFHDEAATFFYYIQSGDFLPFHAHWDANNHWINSMFSHLFYRVFGQHQGIIRLPNLISAGLFFYWLFKLGNLEVYKPLRWPMWCSLLAAQYFLEFFAHSRGYGISFGFLMGVIYFTTQYFTGQQQKHLWLAFLCMTLGLHANLTVVNVSLLWMGITGLFILINGKKKVLSFLPLVLFLAPLAYALLIGLELKAKDLLYYGTPDTFWNVTGKISLQLFFGSDVFVLQAFLAFLLILSLLTFASSIYHVYQNHKQPNAWVVLIPGLFFWGNIAAIIVMHALFGTKYPEDRVGLHLFPLLILSICTPGTWQWLLEQQKKLVWVSALVFMADFIGHANLSASSLLPTEVFPMEVYDHLKESEEATGMGHTISGYRLRELDFAFHNQMSHEGRFGQIQSGDFPSEKADFLLVHLADTSENTTKLYDQLVINPINELALFKRKKFLKRIPLSNVTGGGAEPTNQTYYNLLDLEIDSSLYGKALVLELDMRFVSDERVYEGWWVFDVKSKENNATVEYDSHPLYWARTNWKKDDPRFHQQLYTKVLDENDAHIISYLWNKKEQTYKIEDYTLNIYVLEE